MSTTSGQITVGAIKSGVKAALDEIIENPSSFLDGDAATQNLDTLIESKIDDAVQMIYMSADVALLDTETVEDSRIETVNVIDNDDNVHFDPVVRIYLKNGFLRFVSARIAKLEEVNGAVRTEIPGYQWSYPVYEFIPFTSAEYAKLKNRYTTGTKERPKVGLSITSSKTFSDKEETSVKTLELYSLDGDDVTKSPAVFEAGVDCQIISMRERTMPVGAQTTSDSDTYTIGERLQRPVIYCIAGLVLQAYKDEHADSMLNMAFTMAGVKTNSETIKQ